jgi:hypothetical protein
MEKLHAYFHDMRQLIKADCQIEGEPMEWKAIGKKATLIDRPPIILRLILLPHQGRSIELIQEGSEQYVIIEEEK